MYTLISNTDDMFVYLLYCWQRNFVNTKKIIQLSYAGKPMNLKLRNS